MFPHYAPYSASRAHQLLARPRFLLTVALMPAVIAGAILLWPYVRLAGSLSHEEAAARAEGVPLTPADLRSTPPVPPSENAAPLYRRIVSLTAKVPESVRATDDACVAAWVKGSPTAADRKALPAILERYGPTMRLAEQAAARPSCDFDYDWSKGPSLLLPELSPMRRMTRLFSARALMECEQEDPIAALRDVAVAARTGVHAGQEPGLGQALVRTSCAAIAGRTFVAVLRRYGSRPDVVQQAKATLSAFGAPFDPAYQVGDEPVMDRVSLRIVRQALLPEALKDTVDHPSLATRILYNPVFLIADANQAALIAHWRGIYRITRSHRGDLLAQSQAVQRLDAGEVIQKNRFGYELAHILLPDDAKIWSTILHAEADQNLRQGLVALLEHRSATGRFPDSLSALPAAAVPMDPFTNRPLVYRRTGDGFVLYSVGPDRKDDGGSDARYENGVRRDLVMRYPA